MSEQRINTHFILNCHKGIPIKVVQQMPTIIIASSFFNVQRVPIILKPYIRPTPQLKKCPLPAPPGAIEHSQTRQAPKSHTAPHICFRNVLS